MNERMEVPDTTDLCEFFGAQAVESAPEDGYWCYEVADRFGISLRFSFDLYERSVQTILALGGEKFVSVTYEGAEKVSIVGQTLRCTFASEGARVSLEIELRDRLKLTWAGLRV